MYRCFSIILILFISATILSCGKKEPFDEPHVVFKRWELSIREMNYRNYYSSKAYPKSEKIFREMYRDYYINDLMITDIKEVNEKDINKDSDGNRYLKTSVSFEGTIINRKSRKPYQLLRGEAKMVRFLDGKKANAGWLIANRTMMRTNR